MSFLAPLPMLVAGAITVPALISLYLLKLRRRPVTVSSVQFWTNSTRDLQVNVPLRFLRASWLLLLHLLVLASLLMAMGRPAIRGGGAPADRVVILLDRSASMSATDMPGGATRLDAGKRRANELIDRLSRGDAEACVVGFAHDAVTLATWTRSARVLRRAVEGAEPTDQPGRLGPALRLVETLVAGDADEDALAPTSEAVLFSDGSFAEEGLSLAGATLRFERDGPEDASDNVGIAALSAARDHRDAATVRLFVRLVGTSPTAVPLTLSLDGATIARAAVELTSPSRERPAEGLHTFQLETSGGGVAVVSIGRDDALASDNAAGVVLRPAARPRIVSVVPDEAWRSRVGARVLSETLAALEPARLAEVTGEQYLGATPEDLGAFDLAVFDGWAPPVLPPMPTLSFGVALPVEGLSFGEPAPRSEPVLTWARSDAVMRDVSLDSITVARVLPLGSERPIETLGDVRTGPAIVRLRDGAHTRIFTTFELDQSNWPVMFGFPIFVANAVERLSPGGGGAGVSFTTGEAVRVEADGAVRLLDAAGGVVARGEARAGVATLGVVPRAGVYRLEGAGDPGVAVNLADAHESLLAAPATLTVGGTVLGGDGEGENAPREVWAWFVLGAFVLLGVEWLVYAWQSRV